MQLGFTYYRSNKNRLHNLVAKLRFKRTVIELAQKHNIEGFTLVKALGAWNGETEPSYQMYLEGIDEVTAEQFAGALRDSFEQEAVMVKSGDSVRFI